MLMARELLCYRPSNDLYDNWLSRIAELVNAASVAPAPLHPPRPLLSLAGDLAHGVPPAPPLHDADPEPRHEAP